MLSTGDIDAARLFFERAAAAGAAEGTLELGATYDPNVLRDLGVVGLQGDKARAISYYQQAQAKGAAGAAERLKRLGN
jgi:TPR repeat protein